MVFNSTRPGPNSRRCHFRPCIKCYHLTCFEHLKPWSHSWPEAVIWQHVMLLPSHPELVIKSLRPLLAVWLVPILIVAMILECRDIKSPRCNEYRTRWQASCCIVESLITISSFQRASLITGSMSRYVQNSGSGTIMNNPLYLRQLLPHYEPVCALWSLSKNLFCKSTVRTVWASRSFRHSVVSVWNNLIFATCGIS